MIKDIFFYGTEPAKQSLGLVTRQQRLVERSRYASWSPTQIAVPNLTRTSRYTGEYQDRLTFEAAPHRIRRITAGVLDTLQLGAFGGALIASHLNSQNGGKLLLLTLAGKFAYNYLSNLTINYLHRVEPSIHVRF